MPMTLSGSNGVSFDGVNFRLSPSTRPAINSSYRPSQTMGRIAYTSGATGTVFDTSCCPSNYTAIANNSQLIWFISITGSCDITHIACYAQFSVAGGPWTTCQTYSGAGVQGAWTLTWQSNANNSDTHGTVAVIPQGAYSAGQSIAFRMAFYSPQQYEIYLGGSDSDWLGMRYARGQHMLMETLV